MKKTKTMAFADVWCSLIFLAIGIYAIIESLGFREFKNSTVNPSAFPRFMATGMMVFAMFLLIVSIVKLTKGNLNNAMSAPIFSFKDRGIQGMLLSVVVAVLYWLLWDTVGFLILAPITLFLLMYLIGMRQWVLMALTSVGLTLAIWLLFYKVLSITIPLGPLRMIYDVF